MDENPYQAPEDTEPAQRLSQDATKPLRKAKVPWLLAGLLCWGVLFIIFPHTMASFQMVGIMICILGGLAVGYVLTNRTTK